MFLDMASCLREQRTLEAAVARAAEEGEKGGERMHAHPLCIDYSL